MDICSSAGNRADGVARVIQRQGEAIVLAMAVAGRKERKRKEERERKGACREKEKEKGVLLANGK